MKKVVLDTSVVGLAYYKDRDRTGIFRVAERLMNGLNEAKNEIDLSLVNTEHLPEMLQYLKKFHPQENLKLLNTKSEIVGSKLENSLISAFPLKYKEQNIVREVFLRIRGYVKPSFSFENLDNYNIFHSPFLPIPTSLKNKTKPVKVITIHDLIPLIYPQFFGAWNKIMTQKIIDSIDENTFPICVSESTKQDLCRFSKISPDKVFVVPLAASENLFYQENNKNTIDSILTQYKIPTDKPYFLSLSTLEPRKNIERTIRSFFQLIEQQKIEDVNLVLVGTKGWDFSEIFKEIGTRSDLQNRVIITGFVADEHLAALYSGSLAFIYTSLYEGFGLPPLEAMQCGTPVITSNTSSLPEVVGDGGILVEPTNLSDISHAMYNLYNDKILRNSLAKKALTQASKFSWKTFIDSHIKLYNEIS